MTFRLFFVSFSHLLTCMNLLSQPSLQIPVSSSSISSPVDLPFFGGLSTESSPIKNSPLAWLTMSLFVHDWCYYHLHRPSCVTPLPPWCRICYGALLLLLHLASLFSKYNPTFTLLPCHVSCPFLLTPKCVEFVQTLREPTK